MPRLPKRSSVLCSVVLLLTTAITAAGEQTLVQWQFDTDGDMRGWTLGGSIADGAVREGALRGRTIGADPILFGPPFELAATPTQCVEICLMCTEPAVAELYWTETLEGQYGGFSPRKYRQLHVVGDGQYHVYRVWPFWHAAQKIIRLRFDPPNAGEFAIQWIRVVEDTNPMASDKTAWNAEDIRKQWRDSGDAEAAPGATVLLSPLLAIPAADHAFVSARLATTRAGSARLYCVSDQELGWESISFPLRSDGKAHSYNIAVNAMKHWRSNIIRLVLQLPGLESGDTILESIEVAPEPRGPAELAVTYFGPAEGIQRAGRPTRVNCMVRNLGGEAATHVTATLQTPADVKILDGATKQIEHLSLDLPKTVQWQVLTDTLGEIQLTVRVAAEGTQGVNEELTLRMTPVPQVPDVSYVPEPQPVHSEYEIGAFYFPGFPTAKQWQPILDYPNRKPLLGWYDESNPECADWQIKWAVEHGIDFFMVDWYWVQGKRQLEHWLHNAYGKARYKRYLKWCVMWANHNPPNTHSAEDWRQVTQYWIDNYFHMPEYYRIDGRPAVFIWAPDNVRNDLGGTEQAAELYAMSQEMAKAAGYPGIYFVAMSGHDNPERSQTLVGEGYEGATTYHSFQLAWRRAQSDHFPFADLLDTCPELWREAEKSAEGLHYFPIVDTGWDSRPWHGEKAIVAYDRTPELLGRLCRLARQYADETGKRTILLGPVNEWGEGSYIEPYAEYGFADLDAVRAAFCEPGDWPPNIIPADVGLGPYDLPTIVSRTSWEFDGGSNLEGWTTNAEITQLTVRDGLLTGRTTGSDPVLQLPALQVEAHQLHRLSFRMRSNRTQRVQVFWSTTLTAMHGDASLGIEVVGDGQYHEYELDLSTNPHWRGVIDILRIDPGTEPGVEFALDYVRLQ